MSRGGWRQGLAALCAGALWAGAAFAADPAIPYRRVQVAGKDACIAWADRSFTYTVDAAGSALTPEATEFAAIDAAFQTWQAASDLCSDFRFVRGQPMPDTQVGYDETSTFNNNVLVFREAACRDVVPGGDPCLDDGSCSNAYRCWSRGDYTIALTHTTFTTRTGTIVDADVELNASPHVEGGRYLFTTVSSPRCEEGFEATTCVATDVQNTVTHEIGHVLGLDHVSMPGSTMEATAPVGETHKRILDVGTQDGLCDTYPRGLPAASCFATGGLAFSVEAQNRGTPGFGCQAGPGGAAWAAGWLLLGLFGVARRRR